jgi:predicted AAA+ superfamily ATPase
LEKIFFWRDKHKNEVDIVENGKPIEIKYKNNISKEDLKGVLKFLNTFRLKEGIILTKDLFKEESINNKKILFMPAWFYALIIDNSVS